VLYRQPHHNQAWQNKSIFRHLGTQFISCASFSSKELRM
jgi:hypothetical protein